MTKEQYGRDLGARLHDLHERLVTRRYRHQPIRRVHIPKEGGKTRPIGMSVFEDKLVQDAVREVLEAIYEQDSCRARMASGPTAARTMRCVRSMERCTTGE